MDKFATWCGRRQRQQEPLVQLWSPETKTVLESTPKATSSLEAATRFLALQNTSRELRSVLSNVFPDGPSNSDGFAWAAVLVVACASYSSPSTYIWKPLRRMLIAVGCFVVLALVRKQTKENLRLRQQLLMRIQALDREAKVVGAPMLHDRSPSKRSPGMPNPSSKTEVQTTQLVLDWLLQHLDKELARGLYQSHHIETNLEEGETGNAPSVGLSLATMHNSESSEENSGASMSDDEVRLAAVCTKLDGLHQKQEHGQVLQEIGFSIERGAFLPSASNPSPAMLWRVARACYGLSNQEPLSKDKERRRALLVAGADAASAASGPGPEDGAQGHKFMAMCTMEAASGIKAKIEASHAFLKHTQIAIDSGRGNFDPTLHYMMGAFRMGILKLSWVERKAAAAIYGGPLPPATWEQALESFKTSAALRPGGQSKPEDLVEIGKCLAALNRPGESEDILRECLTSKVIDACDEKAQAEARQLLER